MSFQPLDMEALVSNEEILQFDQDCLVGQGDRVFVERRLGSEVMPSISKKLKNWAFQALDLGFTCFGNGDHAPFILFIDHAGKRHLIELQRAAGVIDSTLIENGREIIHGLESGRFYGLVWDGYVTADGAKQYAVFVEAAVDGGSEALVFAQAYRQKRRSTKLERVGQPIVATNAPHQWS